MRKALLILICIHTFIPIGKLYAQDPYTEYKEFIKKQKQEYNDFRRKENQEFASFLKNYWKPYTKEEAIKAPTQPEPVNPVVYTDPLREPDRIPNVPTVPPLKINPEDKPRPLRPIPHENPQPQEDDEHFILTFYGASLRLSKILDAPFRLTGITENEISQAWSRLSETPYKTLIDDCLHIRKKSHLCDWAYFLLTQKIAQHFCGENAKNEIAFMQMFLLCQSGYKVKNGRTEDQLLLMISTDCIVYGFPYLTIDKERYFIINTPKLSQQEIYTYKKDFSASTQTIHMHIQDKQTGSSTLFSRTLEAKRYPVKVTVNLNQDLIDFYKEYPQCEFTVYACAPVSDEVTSSILSPLQEAIQGKSETDAANILLNFVQTAFLYQTDHEQFGYEKPFFVEETFYYPYCDCEDRAVLYAYLVRELLGLDVVLLNYPQHLATAVLFNGPINGDFVNVSGKRYTVCDPTYINAPIGKAMPQLKDAKVKVISNIITH